MTIYIPAPRIPRTRLSLTFAFTHAIDNDVLQLFTFFKLVLGCQDYSTVVSTKPLIHQPTDIQNGLLSAHHILRFSILISLRKPTVATMIAFKGFRNISYSRQTSVTSESDSNDPSNISFHQGNVLTPPASPGSNKAFTAASCATHERRPSSIINELLNAANKKIQLLSDRRGSEFTPPPSPGTEAVPIIGERPNHKRRQSSISDLLVAVNNKLQKVTHLLKAPVKSSIEETDLFSDKYTLDLPAHISRDKSEIEYLRRTNAEAAAKAIALKDVLVQPAEVIIATVDTLEELEIISGETRVDSTEFDPGISPFTEDASTLCATEEATEIVKEKLARNPFWPCRDLRLGNWKSAEERALEAAKLTRYEEFERYALSLTFEEVQAMIRKPDYCRIFNIRWRAKQGVDSERFRATCREEYEIERMELLQEANKEQAIVT